MCSLVLSIDIRARLLLKSSYFHFLWAGPNNTLLLTAGSWRADMLIDSQQLESTMVDRQESACHIRRSDHWKEDRHASIKSTIEIPISLSRASSSFRFNSFPFASFTPLYHSFTHTLIRKDSYIFISYFCSPYLSCLSFLCSIPKILRMIPLAFDSLRSKWFPRQSSRAVNIRIKIYINTDK